MYFSSFRFVYYQKSAVAFGYFSTSERSIQFCFINQQNLSYSDIYRFQMILNSRFCFVMFKNCALVLTNDLLLVIIFFTVSTSKKFKYLLFSFSFRFFLRVFAYSGDGLGFIHAQNKRISNERYYLQFCMKEHFKALLYLWNENLQFMEADPLLFSTEVT